MHFVQLTERREMNKWFRLYTDILDDPKVQKLPSETFKDWVNILCLASKYDGSLPPLSDISFALRRTESDCASLLSKLTNAGLIDEKRGVLRPHNWDARQYKSDSSTDRVKRYRKRSRNVPETASGAHQIQNRTETDTETEQNRGEGKGAGAPPSVLSLGQFGHAVMTPAERASLTEKLNGSAEDFIEQFDCWVHEAPDAKKDGIRRRDRRAYPSILSWFNRAVKEGKIKGHPQQAVTESDIEAARLRLQNARSK